MSTADAAAVLSTTGLNEAQKIKLLGLKGLSPEEAEATLRNYAYAASENAATAGATGLTAATGGLKAAFVGLKAAFKANPIGFIATAAITAITIFQSLASHTQNASEAAEESAKKTKEIAENAKKDLDSLDELIDKYKEIKSSGAWDEKSRIEIQNIQSKITDLVGDEADNLDLVNGKLDIQLATLKNIAATKAKEKIGTYEDAVTNSINDAKNAEKTKEGVYRVPSGKDEREKLKKISNGRVEFKVKEPRWGPFYGAAYMAMEPGENFKDTFEAISDMIEWYQEYIPNAEERNKNETYKALTTIKNGMDEKRKEVVNSSKDLVEGLLLSNDYSNRIVKSYDGFITLRNEIISELSGNSTIQTALKEGFIDEDWIEQQTNSYLSGINKFSDYYDEWYRKNASETVKRSEEFKKAFAESLDPNDDKTENKIAAFNAWFDSLTDSEKEIVFDIKTKYNNDHVKSELEAFSEGGTVDLTLRPQVDSSELKKAGWDVEDGTTATVLTTTYSSKDGIRALNFTPIIADEKGNFKGVLSPDELQEYAEGVINGTREDNLKLQIGAEFNSIEAAEEAADAIRQYQDWFYSGRDVDNFGLFEWKEALANYEVPETDKFHFSDLISDEDFQKRIKEYKDNINTLSNALNDLRGDGLSDANKIELFEKFPELASQTDDLDSAIVNLLNDYKTDVIVMFNEELQYMKTDDDVTSLNALRDSVLGLIDGISQISTVEIENLNKELDALQGTYKNLQSIADNYNKNGYYSTDDLQKLLELEPHYLNMLIDENGQINLNSQAYKNYMAAKAQTLVLGQIKTLYETVLQMSAEEAQAYKNATAYNVETDSLITLIKVTSGYYYGLAKQKDAENNTTAYTNAMARSFDTVGNYVAIYDSWLNSLNSSTNEFTEATDKATTKADAQTEALKEQKSALEDNKKALEDYKDSLNDAQDDIQNLIDLVIEYIKHTKEDEKEALEKQKSAYDEIIDKKKEALRLAKEEKETNDEIADKQNKVAKDTLALSAASLDDSSAGKKAQKKAKDNFIESNKDLQNKLYENEYDMRVSALEKEQEQRDEWYDKQIEKIDDYLNDARKIYEDACDMIDKDTGDLYGKLWKDYVYPYTTKTRAEFNHLWSSAQTAILKYKGENQKLIDLMELLQRQIYNTDSKINNLNTQIDNCESKISELDSAISDTGNSINSTSVAINNVSKSLAGLGSNIAEYVKQLKGLTELDTTFSVTHNGKTYTTQHKYNGDTKNNRMAAAVELTNLIAQDENGFDQYGLQIVEGYLGLKNSKKQWYFDYRGTRYTALSSNKDYAVSEILEQYLAQNGNISNQNKQNLEYLIRNTIKHYASGTRNSDSLAITQEDGLEAIFGKLSSGQYTMMPQGSQVFTSKQTDNLFNFSANPDKFLSEITKRANYSDYIASKQGNFDSIAKSIVNNIDNSISENITINSAPIYIQGDTTESAVKIFAREREKMINDTIDRLTKIREKKRRATIR